MNIAGLFKSESAVTIRGDSVIFANFSQFLASVVDMTAHLGPVASF